MTKTLQEVLETDLSPENVRQMSYEELNNFLVENGIVKGFFDIKMLIVEGIEKALINDDEFPIHYYSKDEPMSEEGKEVNPVPCLTDEYIENNMNS